MSSPTPPLAYLHLRWRALGRLAREVGWLRLVLLLPLLALGLMQALVQAAGHPVGRWAVPLLAAGQLLVAHRQRDDYRFLATVAPGFRAWLAVEYVLAGLPVVLLLVVLHAPGPAVLTLGLGPLVAWAPPASGGRASRHRWRSPFRSEAFEWVSGTRAAQGLWLWPVLLALAAWQRASALAPVGALAVWLLVLLPHYGTPEPPTMLLLAARSPEQFLQRRLALGLGYAAGTAAPFGVMLGTGPAGWGAALAVAVFWLTLVAMIILTKYAFYPSAIHVRITQELVLAVGLGGAWHPAYPPLMLVIAGGLVWQSRRRLREVLGALVNKEKASSA
ncbi:MAG: hypothetical protein ACRYG7_55160 [Janthinobacterium lividum]